MSTSEVIDRKLKRHKPSKKGGMDAFELMDDLDTAPPEGFDAESVSDVQVDGETDAETLETGLSLQSADDSGSDLLEADLVEVSSELPEQSLVDDDSDDGSAVEESEQPSVALVVKRKKKSVKTLFPVSSVNPNIRRRRG